MKIGLVGFTVPGSGVNGIKGMDNYIYQLGKHYVQAGHDVRLFVRDGFKPKEGWIKTVYAPKASWMLYPAFLTPRLLRESADVYHSDYITTGVSMMWAHRRPSVVSIHDVIPFSHPIEGGAKTGLQSWWYFRCFNSIKNADAIVVGSENAKKEAMEFTDLDKGKIHVVHNGPGHDGLHPIKKPVHDKVRIGYLGGLDGRKNVRLLVDSFIELQKSHDNIELHVGGKGANLDVFRNMNIPNAFFHGFVPDGKVNEFYNSIDIFVFPSLAEGFGNMSVEAMAAGTPIVVANRTSLPEVVGDAGLVAEPDVTSMCATISKLIDSEKLRARMSRLGLERAKLFTWDRCAEKMLKVYGDVMER